MGLLSALLASILLAVAFFKGYTRQVGRDLRAYADLILAGADNLDDAASFGAYAAADRRITVISASGEVLYDSASPGLQLENHLLRPEVAAAQRTGEGYAVRRSDTLGRQVHYCAVRMDNGSVLRVSVESALLLPPAGTIAWQLALMLAVLTGLAVLLAVILTRKILKPIYALASDGAGLSAEEGRIYPELRPFVREIRTQRDQILAQMRKLEGRGLPEDLDYSGIGGLRLEAAEKLNRPHPACQRERAPAARTAGRLRGDGACRTRRQPRAAQVPQSAACPEPHRLCGHRRKTAPGHGQQRVRRRRIRGGHLLYRGRGRTAPD